MFDDGYLEMYKKFDNMLDLKVSSDITYIASQLLEWKKARPNSEPIQKVVNTFTELTLIVNRLQMDRRMYHKSLKEYRDRANSLVLDKRDLQEQLNKLTNENTNRTDNY